MKPRKIVVNTEAQQLFITWLDGHESIYGLDGLRASCPCASCAGGHEHMGSLPSPEVFTREPARRWEKVRIQQVGSYAIRAIWDDGHEAGIYTWERLRSICPCCRSESSAS